MEGGTFWNSEDDVEITFNIFLCFHLFSIVYPFYSKQTHRLVKK